MYLVQVYACVSIQTLELRAHRCTQNNLCGCAISNGMIAGAMRTPSAIARTEEILLRMVRRLVPLTRNRIEVMFTYWQSKMCREKCVELCGNYIFCYSIWSQVRSTTPTQYQWMFRMETVPDHFISLFSRSIILARKQHIIPHGSIFFAVW